MRDVKEFQERFNRYKNGESVSDIYNLPKYGDGKKWTYKPSNNVRKHIAKWEAEDFAKLNELFGGDAVGAKARELSAILGLDIGSKLTTNLLDGLLSTYYNISPDSFRKHILPSVLLYASNPTLENANNLHNTMMNRWTIAPKKYLRGIKRRAAADTLLMGIMTLLLDLNDWSDNWKNRILVKPKERPQIQVSNSTDGGYTKQLLLKNNKVYKDWDPSGGIGLIDYVGNKLLGGNQASGEEDQYWRGYLGLSNNIPRMNPRDATYWDKQVEQEKFNNGQHLSDFYGGTDRMKFFTEAVADTLNLGKLVRTGNSAYEGLYETGKRILNNPYKYQQVYGDDVEDAINILNGENGEYNPLGMLADFGLMWDPLNLQLLAHDTYDFPWCVKFLSNIPERPKEMKIRYSVPFSPYVGSTYFNTGTRFMPKPITTK